MRVISVNVGLPRTLVYRGKEIVTGIFKEPVVGRIMLKKLNLEGDRQADLSVHGGPDKAVYAYPAEHYDFWRGALPNLPGSWGAFGESLDTEGMMEDEVYIGDRYRVGSAELMVTEPRLPCYKLAARFGRDDIIKRFLESRRTGFYFAVAREGYIGADDEIELLSREETSRLSVADVVRLYAFDKDNVAGLRRAVEAEALPESWRGYFRGRLKKLARKESQSKTASEPRRSRQ